MFRGPVPRRLTAEQFTDAVWTLAGTAPATADAPATRPAPASADPGIRPRAAWIWRTETAESPPGESLCFRAAIDLDRPVDSATVVMTADNAATLFINGRRVAVAGDWSRPVTAATADLRKGPNTILVAAANADSGGPAAVRVEIHCRLVDGTVRTIATDGSWEWTTHMPDAAGRFPGGSEPTGWTAAAVVANPSAWRSAEPAFAAAVAAAASPAVGPMVRAALVKSTPLMAALGRPNRDQVVTSRPTDLTTLEAILLANEQSLADEIGRGGARILATHGPDPDRITSWIFTAALSRPPTPAEADVARGLIGGDPTDEGVADLLWTVVMLPEFQLVR